MNNPPVWRVFYECFAVYSQHAIKTVRFLGLLNQLIRVCSLCPVALATCARLLQPSAFALSLGVIFIPYFVSAHEMVNGKDRHLMRHELDNCAT